MAQRSIEILIGRLITDEAFRNSFCGDPAFALAGFIGKGHELTAIEIEAFMATQPDFWGLVAEQVDPRLQKASLGSATH